MTFWIKELCHLIMTYALRCTVWLRLPKKSYPDGSVMVIAPHPDDEIIGAGGMILHAVAQRQIVHLVYLTDGEAACPGKPTHQVKAQRRALTKEVALQLGLPSNHQHYLRLPDGTVPQRGDTGYAEARQALQQLVNALKPDHVFATHELDYWPFDHVACAHLIEDALVAADHRANLFFYWVWAWYHLRPWQLFRLADNGLFAVSTTAFEGEKQRLVATYLEAHDEDGNYWSGDLPIALRRASRFSVEILQHRDQFK